MKRVIYTVGKCFQHSTQEDHLMLFGGTYVNPYLCPLDIRSNMLPLETLFTDLAFVKFTWPELWC